MSETEHLPDKKEKKKGEWVYILLILLLLGMNGAFGWMWWNEKGHLKIITIEKENKEKDAEIVKQELIALKAQYDNLETDNEGLQKEVEMKRAEIEQLQKELEKHKDNAYIISKLRKETETLRKIMQHFVHEIDSLNTLNKIIIADRELVRGELKAEKDKNIILTGEKEGLQKTVNIASMLKAVGIKAVGIMDKKGGKKEVETKKAKKTDKIKITFTLAENIVAKAGDRTIYARIVSPDGKEMAQTEDEAHTFSFGNSKGYWATKKNVNYSNENTDVVMYAHTKEGAPFVNGKYVIEVTTDGVPVGSTTLELE